MLKLINLTNHEYDTSRFNKDSNILKDYLKSLNLDGIELLHCSPWIEGEIYESQVIGVHLSFYPFWVDFWKEDKEALIKEFDNEDNIRKFYGSLDKNIIIEQYREELAFAREVKAEYMVFHVSHVNIDESYYYKFKYSNEEIIDAAISLINEVFVDDPNKHNPKLLFENLWWPGLNFLEKTQLKRLYEAVNYSNRGFIFDTSHLINTNANLKSEEEAIDYCIEKIDALGEYKKYIYGIHFNFYLSGDYVKNVLKNGYDIESTFEERYYNVYSHISKIDNHKNFTLKKAKQIVDIINPQYIVYELSGKNLESLTEMIKKHNYILE